MPSPTNETVTAVTAFETPEPTRTPPARSPAAANTPQVEAPPPPMPTETSASWQIAATVPVYAPFDPDLAAPPTAVPTPVALFEGAENTTVFALLGNDVAARRGGRTDSIVLVAVNQNDETVRLLSIPRDLYVAVPGWTMQRINLAYAHGGPQLFKQTAAYNLGIPIDHTVRLGFDGFKEIVDILGGISVVVNCPVEDYRLKAPDLDPMLESSWELFKLDYGIQEMDGELALWYARSRRRSSDFDRGRRQQKLLRALAAELRKPETLEAVPALVQALWTAVETDLTLDEGLALAGQAARLSGYRLENLLLPQTALRAWTIPESGEAVQLLDWDEAAPALQGFMSAGGLGTAARAPIRVVIMSDDYVLSRQAAENLAWYGFEPAYEPLDGDAPLQTEIAFYGSSLKGAFADTLAWLLRQEPSSVAVRPLENGERPYYRLRLAGDYNPCLDYLGGPE